jgi:predicted alpha-1,6-mannanase (GH76 family)
LYRACRRLTLALLLAVAMNGALCPVARAFTAADADAIYSAQLKAFYFTNAEGGFFRATTDGGKTFFWQCAEQMEMLLDGYERRTNAGCLMVFSNAFNGFIADHGTNWEQNEFNDDIMWMVIACARAQQLSGHAAWRDAAKFNFDLCYARAWSTNLGGGLWWKTSNRSKNACVNGPAAIAAFLLYQIYADTNYLAKSRAIYAWERNTLFDRSGGRIYDNINDEGKISHVSFTYNQGTFIGAANFLGYTNDARLAADYTRDYMCWEGLLPGYGQDGDAAGFNGIGVRWLARFMKDRGFQSRYQAWLQANADAAWQCRRAADNLAWSRWYLPTPADEPLYSWACSSSVVILQVTPPTR